MGNINKMLCWRVHLLFHSHSLLVDGILSAVSATLTSPISVHNSRSRALPTTSFHTISKLLKIRYLLISRIMPPMVVCKYMTDVCDFMSIFFSEGFLFIPAL